MKKFIVQIAFVHVWVLASVFSFHVFFKNSRENGLLLDSKNKRQWIDRLHNQNFDYAVLGSSRAHGAFDMNLLDSLTSRNGINISADGSGFLDNLLTLNRFIKQGNLVDTLFLVVDLAVLNSKESLSTPFHPFDFISQPGTADIDTEMVSNMTGLDQSLFQTLPSFFVLKYNTETIRLSLKNRLKGRGNENYFIPNKGGIEMTHDEVYKPQGQMREPVTSLKVNTEDFWFLTQIVKFCNEKQITIIPISVPVFLHSEEVSQKIEEEKYIKELLLGLNKTYIESPKEISVDVENFKDRGHLNNQGIHKFTFEFAEKYKSGFQ